MRAKDFDYFLPQDLIAQHPMEPRDHSRLMLLDKTSGRLQHDIFSNLCEYLQKDDLLIFNDTRVIPARLHGVKESGAKAEVLLLTRINTTDWEVLVRPGKKLQVGTTIIFSEDLTCNVISNTDFGGRTIRFSYKGVFEEILDRLGETPLPPYINEPLKDSERYQTVYARERGSAAAPTAGLHFTKELLEKIKRTGAEMVFVTLHVGLGTFRPVSVANVENHVMHKEFYSVTPQAADKINEAKKAGRRIVAVGTTAVRTLEASGKDGLVKAGSNWTEIFIYPGYEFRIADALITNFHLPQSTLLMLVSALSSREAILQAYGTAVQEKYRFFSFGDAMFIR
ncbi:MAG: tRNA preQ1(34) S-adenosylmethionine ribosyltransferase-isomerase QueA [Acholeplasmataceae bacterium]|nr:tRNA preQ1(34) S-adenosylmethionine ribosyltransferase-isomerase QueA [Acidaminococcaceae bacterium]NLY83277.1 tRNA preQ1(34) S-adenosylmethionine ribosyltransferase-isomerase QueA [Acholeplasmataceae bacterium]